MREVLLQAGELVLVGASIALAVISFLCGVLALRHAAWLIADSRRRRRREARDRTPPALGVPREVAGTRRGGRRDPDVPI